MAKIGEWLQPAVADELLTTNTIESVVFDEHLGSYKTQGIRITTPKGQRIDVKPHARFIMEFEGRVDLLSGPAQYGKKRSTYEAGGRASASAARTRWSIEPS